MKIREAFEITGKLFLIFLFFVLIIPALNYSLNTPFALIDDYGDWLFIFIPDDFFNWVKHHLLYSGQGRFRPVYEISNLLSWRLYGPSPFLHHLSRWILKILSCLFFLKVYYGFRVKDARRSGGFFKRILFELDMPVILFFYLFFFFPNNPEARLAPQELHTVFFLSIMSYGIVYFLKKENGNINECSFFTCATIYTGIIGLAYSKEINVAVILFNLLFLFLLQKQRLTGRAFLKLTPLIILMVHLIWKTWGAFSGGGYGTSEISLRLLFDNLLWLLQLIFLSGTNIILTAFILFFISLLVPDLFRAFIILFRKEKIQIKRDRESLILFYIFGELISFLCILILSWKQALRYTYPLVPLMILLIVFGVRRWSSIKLPSIKKFQSGIVTVCFLLLFVLSGYFNFILQFAIQYHVRKTEKRMLDRVENLLSAGNIVALEKKAEAESKVFLYFNRFLPHYFQKDYHIFEKSKAKHKYLVSRRKNIKGYRIFEEFNEDYSKSAFVRRAFKLSAKFQYENRPYWHADDGVSPPNYTWYIYKKL